MTQEEIEKSKVAVQKIKEDVAKMKAEAKPDDMIPASVMFVLMEAMIPVMEGMVQKLESQGE